MLLKDSKNDQKQSLSQVDLWIDTVWVVETI
jgi:hypothetical protein